MRIDKPRLRCERCHVETEDLAEMARFSKLTRYQPSGRDDWDLCRSCWTAFLDFIGAARGGES